MSVLRDAEVNLMDTSNISSTPSITEDAEDSNAVIVGRTVALAIFYVGAFIGCLFVVAVVCHSQALRNYRFNIFLTNLCLSVLIETAFNATLTLAYSAATNWDFGGSVCQVHVYLLHATDSASLITITIMWADRLVAVRTPTNYAAKMRPHVVVALIAIIWALPILTPIPFLIYPELSRPHGQRFVCVAAQGGEAEFWIPLYSALYFLPNILSAVFMVLVVYVFVREPKATLASVNYGDYADAAVFPQPPLQAAVPGCKLTMMLWVLWLICFGPFIGISFGEALMSSMWFGGKSSNLVPNSVQTAVTCLKSAYGFVAVISIFVWSDTLWKKFKDLVFVRKSNIINNDDGGSSHKGQATIERQKRPRVPSDSRVPFKFPTVFASRRGLRIGYTGAEEPAVNEEPGIDNRHHSQSINHLQQESEEINSDMSDCNVEQTNQSTNTRKLNSPCLERQESMFGVRKEDTEMEQSAPFREKTHSGSADSGISSAQDSVGRKQKLLVHSQESSLADASEINCTSQLPKFPPQCDEEGLIHTEPTVLEKSAVKENLTKSKDETQTPATRAPKKKHKEKRHKDKRRKRRRKSNVVKSVSTDAQVGLPPLEVAKPGFIAKLPPLPGPRKESPWEVPPRMVHHNHNTFTQGPSDSGLSGPGYFKPTDSGNKVSPAPGSPYEERTVPAGLDMQPKESYSSRECRTESLQHLNDPPNNGRTHDANLIVKPKELKIQSKWAVDYERQSLSLGPTATVNRSEDAQNGLELNLHIEKSETITASQSTRAENDNDTELVTEL